MRQLEPGDTILASYNCARIQGLDVVDGLLLLCKVHMHQTISVAAVVVAVGKL